MSSQSRLAEYQRDHAERPYLARARDDTLSDEERLAYARLVEPKHPERAEWLRLEVALHARATDDPATLARFIALAPAVGLDFADLLLRARIMNCGSEALRIQPPRVRFSFACSKRWQTLAGTASESERHCQQCDERVYYCDTIADAETRALAGQCIAVPKQLADDDSDEPVMLGRPAPTLDWGGRLFTYGPGSRGAGFLQVIYATVPQLLGRIFALGSPTGAATTIGRAADNTIVLSGDGVSRTHARFERRQDSWWVIDSGSTNGTHVNDEPVTEKQLRRGDRILIGATIFKLVDTPPRSASGYTVSEIDGLTGLHNRRHLHEQIDGALQTTGPLTLALLDIDGFKRINDSHGHLAGDRVLRELAARMRPHVRPGDLLARHAGDQFALLLPATPLDEATTITDEIRAKIAALTIDTDGPAISVTLSAGVATAGPDDRTADALIHAADANLYLAKRARRSSP